MKEGGFYTGTATGNKSITGVGFQPTAVIFMVSRATANNAFATEADTGIGVATSSTKRGAHAIYQQYGGVQTGMRQSDAKCILTTGNTGGADMEADFVSMDSGGFTINITDAPASSTLIHYLALGGSDLTNATVGTMTFATSTGNQQVTGVGFQPDFVLLFGGELTTTPANASGWQLGIGAATSTSARAAMAIREANTATSALTSAQLSNRIIVETTTNAMDAEADFVSFDTDGFTVNWTDAPASAYKWTYLALKGGSYKVGVDTQKTSTGTKATTGVGFQPAGLLLFGWNLAASASIDTTQGKMSLGATDGITESTIWGSGEDNTTTPHGVKRPSEVKVFQHASQSGTTSTLNAEADLASFNSDGFTLNWTTADTTAREFVYVAFGPPTATTSLPPQGVVTKQGTFTSNTSTGNQSVTGMGFRGKALILWTTGQTAAGATDNATMSIGVAVSPTMQFATSAWEDDNVSTTNSSSGGLTTRCLYPWSANKTVDAAYAFVSWDADGFTLNIVDAPASAILIHYFVIGGSDITEAFAGTFSIGNGTGNKTISAVGFRGDFLLTLNNLNADNDHITNSIGIATSSSAQAYIGNSSNDAKVASDRWYDVRTTTSTDCGMVSVSHYTFDFVKWTPDGFVVDQNTNAGFDTTTGYLVLKGGSYKVGTETQATSATTKATTGVGFQPSGLLAFGYNGVNPLAGNDAYQLRLTLGASDGTTAGNAAMISSAGYDGFPTNTARFTSTTKVIGHYTAASTTNAEAGLQSFDEDGFTLNWTTADATARQFVYVAFGPESLKTGSTGQLLVRAGNFQKTTSAATVSQSITGVGFKPKAIIFWGDGIGVLDSRTQNDAGMYWAGFSDGTNDAAVAIGLDEAQATTDTYKRMSASNAIVIIEEAAGTLSAAADVTSFDSDGFTLSWTTNDAKAYYIRFLALGGEDITNVKVGSFSTTTGTGSLSITDPGFQPDFAMFLATNQTTADSSAANAQIGLGMASGASNEGSITFLSRDAVDTDTVTHVYTRERTDNSINMLDTGGADELLYDLTSFDSTGFTFNKTTSDSVSTVYYLAIKGGRHIVSNFTKTTTAVDGTNQSITGTGFRPSAVFFASQNATASSSIVSGNDMTACLGSSDSAAETTACYSERDAGCSGNSCIRAFESNSIALALMPVGQIDAQADLEEDNSSVDSTIDDNGWTFNWADQNTTTASEVLYWAIAPTAVPDNRDLSSSSTPTLY